MPKTPLQNGHMEPPYIQMFNGFRIGVVLLGIEQHTTPCILVWFLLVDGEEVIFNAQCLPVVSIYGDDGIVLERVAKRATSSRLSTFGGGVLMLPSILSILKIVSESTFSLLSLPFIPGTPSHYFSLGC